VADRRCVVCKKPIIEGDNSVTMSVPSTGKEWSCHSECFDRLPSLIDKALAKKGRRR